MFSSHKLCDISVITESSLGHTGYLSENKSGENEFSEQSWKKCLCRGLMEGRENPLVKPARLLTDWCYFEFSYNENKEKRNFKLHSMCIFSSFLIDLERTQQFQVNKYFQ